MSAGESSAVQRNSRDELRERVVSEIIEVRVHILKRARVLNDNI